MNIFKSYRFSLAKKGAGVLPKYRLRLQPKNLGSDRLRNTEKYYKNRTKTVKIGTGIVKYFLFFILSKVIKFSTLEDISTAPQSLLPLNECL